MENHSDCNALGMLRSMLCVCGVIFQEFCFILKCPNVAAAEVKSEVLLFLDVAKLVKKFVYTHRFKM